jgi:DNA polymerase-1
MDYNGQYTNALHGFLNMLLRCMKERSPRWCAVAFDEHAPTFRHTEYAEYKAGRARTPDELRPQFDSIKEILTAMGLGVLSLTGYEADDILGTLSLQCREKGVDALYASGPLGRWFVEGFGAEGRYFESQEALIAALPELLRKDDAVLVKASLGMHYDKVVEGIRQL